MVYSFATYWCRAERAMTSFIATESLQLVAGDIAAVTKTQNDNALL